MKQVNDGKQTMGTDGEPLIIRPSNSPSNCISFFADSGDEAHIHEDDLPAFCKFVAGLPRTEGGRLALPWMHIWDSAGQEWVIASLYFISDLQTTVLAWRGSRPVDPAEPIKVSEFFSTKEAQEAAAEADDA